MMMKTPIASAAVACKVWTRSGTTPCIFGRSVYESLRNENCTNNSSSPQLSQNYHCDRMLVDFEEKEDGSVVLTTAANEESRTKAKFGAKEIPKYSGIPLGRARDCPTLTSRALEDDRLDLRRRPFVKLAVVGMVFVTEENEEDTISSVLITRRPSYMRSFPGAYVFPGGNVDDEDESLEHALSREFFEECGLTISEDSWKLECLWESIYPTHLLDLPEQDTTASITDRNDDISQLVGAIKAHHMVCYYSGKLEKQNPANASLNLCQEEVDGAVWITRDNIQDLLEATSLIEGNANGGFTDILKDQTIVLQTDNSNTTSPGNDIPLSDLAGIYPRLDIIKNQSYGMAQGSLFALEELVRRN